MAECLQAGPGDMMPSSMRAVAVYAAGGKTICVDRQFASVHGLRCSSSSCNAGALTMATCTPKPCDASVAPVNGAVGNCSSSVAFGSICQPSCSAG
jgi:hypothetical protein